MKRRSLPGIFAALGLAAALGLVAAGYGADEDLQPPAPAQTAPTTEEAPTAPTPDEAVTTPTTEEAETLPPTPARKKFIAEADAICAEADAEIEAQAREMFRDGPPDREEQERFITETWVPIMQEQIERLRGLTPPKYDRRAIRLFLGGDARPFEDVAEEPGLALSAPSADAPGTFDEVEEDPGLVIPDPSDTRSFLNPSHEIAEEYGFRKCFQ